MDPSPYSNARFSLAVPRTSEIASINVALVFGPVVSNQDCIKIQKMIADNVRTEWVQASAVFPRQ